MSVLGFQRQDNLLGKLGSLEEAAQPFVYFMKDAFATGGLPRGNGCRVLKTG